MNARTVVADHPRPRSIGGSASRAMDLLRDLATDKPIRCSRQSRAALKQRLAQVEDLITLGRRQFARDVPAGEFFRQATGIGRCGGAGPGAVSRGGAERYNLDWLTARKLARCMGERKNSKTTRIGAS